MKPFHWEYSIPPNHLILFLQPSQVGLIQSDMLPDARREAYLDDVTYVTNSELGFDYLRDNLAGVSRQCGVSCSAFLPEIRLYCALMRGFDYLRDNLAGVTVWC